RARNQSFAHQTIDKTGEISVRDHQATRQLAHRQTARRFRRAGVELCQEVEAGKGGVELLAQPAANAPLDDVATREQAKPCAKNRTSLRDALHFLVQWLGAK